METRGRKRQQEAEAAHSAAPVETRRQKAARLARFGGICGVPGETRAPRGTKRRFSEPISQKSEGEPAKKVQKRRSDISKHQALEETKKGVAGGKSLEDLKGKQSRSVPDKKAGLKKPEIRRLGQENSLALEENPLNQEGMDRKGREALKRQLLDGLGDEVCLISCHVSRPVSGLEALKS